MTRVLVKASSAIMRAGLEQMIASDPDLDLVSEDQGGWKDTRLSEDEQPDVIIAETEDAEAEVDLSDAVGDAGPRTALLLLADDPGSISTGDTLRAGVRGILPKRVSRDELVAAIHAVAAGLFVVHPDGAASAFPARPPGARRFGSLVEPLTTREKEVLSILAEGGSNKDIASRLSISEHTAKFHVSSIISKLGATSRTEAVTMAIRQGIIMV